MGKVDIRVFPYSLQKPTESYTHPFSEKSKKDKLIDNVKMAGNLVIEVTAHYRKRERKQLRKRSIILGKLHFWITLQPTEIFLQP